MSFASVPWQIPENEPLKITGNRLAAFCRKVYVVRIFFAVHSLTEASIKDEFDL